MSTDGSLERRPDRDHDGRPLNNGASLLPPLEDNLREVVGDYLRAKARFETTDRKLLEIQEAYMLAWAATIVAVPLMSQQDFERRNTWDDKPIREAGLEQLEIHSQRRQDCRNAKQRINATFNQMKWGSDSSLDPWSSDFNVSTEAPNRQEYWKTVPNPREYVRRTRVWLAF